MRLSHALAFHMPKPVYLVKINMLLDTYAPLKRINKYKLKFKSKAWITLGLQKINTFKKQNILGEIGKY